MPADFKTITLRPVTGAFDTLSSPDEIGFGNFKLVKNATTRSQRNRQRAGGWRRLFADDDPYNNQDLHDQLVDRLSYYGQYVAHAMGGMDYVGLGYPYYFPTQEGPYSFAYDPITQDKLVCPAYYPDYGGVGGQYVGCPIFYPFVGYPYVKAAQLNGICDTGSPWFYPYSFFYSECLQFEHGALIEGYPYGPSFPVYGAPFSYDYIYCDDLFFRPGCREAITALGELVLSTGRKLFAATMSRVYEYNQSSGSWRVLADGLGNSGYTAAQCGCNSVRGIFAKFGVYLIYTNNFDPVLIYMLGAGEAECSQQALVPITDLLALGITRAGGAIEWKGFLFIWDYEEDGERKGGDVRWSDFEDPNSFIESDTSLAGFATIAVGETILNAAPLGNWLLFYTDKRIIRCSLVAGEDVFNFEDIYKGSQSTGDALKYKFSLINAGDIHLYLGEHDCWAFTQFDTRPVMVPWITKACAMIFNGITEDDATYERINEELCNLVTGGYNERTKEAYLSWPSGDNACPDVTLRFNLKYSAADLVDHGFTAFQTFRKELRPTFGAWLEELGVCDRGSQVASGSRDGAICPNSSTDEATLLYMRNATEDPDLPVDPQSLCARLQGKTLDDFCRDCAAPDTFIMASAGDFTLKQWEDDVYYRERLAFLPSCDYEHFGNYYGLYTGFAQQQIALDEWIPLGALPCGEVTAGEVGATGSLAPPIFTNCEVVNVTGGALTGADWNTAYSTSLTATGGTAPYTWTLVSGTLPDGVTLASDGTLSGTPTTFGDFSFSAKATDALGNSCTAAFTLNVDLGADLWLKADSASSIVGLTDGQNVDTWFDISGNNFHFVVAPLSADVPPIYRTGILNGKPGIDFGVLGGLSNQTYFRGNGDSLTVFIVLQSYSNVVVGRRAIEAGAAIGGHNFLLGPYTGSWRFFNGAFVTGPAIDLNPHYAYITVDGGTNNGTFVFDGSTIGSNVGTQTWGFPGLGNLYTGEDFLGYVFEMIVFGRVLSAAEIGYVTTYLKAQWGLP